MVIVVSEISKWEIIHGGNFEKPSNKDLFPVFPGFELQDTMTQETMMTQLKFSRCSSVTR